MDAQQAREQLEAQATERAFWPRTRSRKTTSGSASAAKSEFLANMSHENRASGHDAILLDTQLDVEQRSYVETAQESAEALLAFSTTSRTSLSRRRARSSLRC